LATFKEVMTRLAKQAKGTRSDSMRRNYLRQAQSKEGDLGRARDAEIKLAGDISVIETKLSDQCGTR